MLNATHSRSLFKRDWSWYWKRANSPRPLVSEVLIASHQGYASRGLLFDGLGQVSPGNSWSIEKRGAWCCPTIRVLACPVFLPPCRKAGYKTVFLFCTPTQPQQVWFSGLDRCQWNLAPISTQPLPYLLTQERAPKEGDRCPCTPSPRLKWDPEKCWNKEGRRSR